MRHTNSFILLFCFAINVVAIAQTHIWTNNADDGNWHNILNWTTNSIPTTSSDVLIPENSNVTISQSNAVANSIEINAFANLNIAENLTISQNIIILENAEIYWYQGTISDAVIENDGHISIESFDTKDLSNTIINNRKTITITNSNVIRFFGTTTINNTITGEVIINSNGGIIEQTASVATINNEGLIKKLSSESGGAFYMIYDMNNSGIIDIGLNQTFLFLVTGQNFRNLDNGILQGNGSFDITSNFINTGSISPGETDTLGTLEVVNNFSLSDSANLVIDIDGLASEDYDFLSVFGSPDLNGTISINLNYDAAIGDTFTILSAALGINSCNFPSQVNASFNDFNYTFNVICGSNTIQLEVADVTLNINAFNEDTSHFIVTPNPINVASKFILPDNLNTVKTSISIYNYLGQELSTHSARKMSIANLSNLTSGLYFAQLKHNNRILATTRFIIP